MRYYLAQHFLTITRRLWLLDTMMILVTYPLAIELD